jgi:hypothetical protein
MPGESDYGRSNMKNFTVFYKHPESLQYRNKRLNLRRLSLHADIVKQRCVGIGLQFRHVMQADFIVFLWAHVHEAGRWWPVTLLYASSDFGDGAFELYARSKSLSYFNKFKAALGIESKEQLEQLLKRFESNATGLPQWEFTSLHPRGLMAFDAIGTKP